MPFLGVSNSEEYDQKSDNFLQQSVAKVVNDEYINKSKGRSKSVAVSSIHSLYQNHINQKQKMHRFASNGNYHKHRQSQSTAIRIQNGAKSQNNSPKNNTNSKRNTAHFTYSNPPQQNGKNGVKGK